VSLLQQADQVAYDLVDAELGGVEHDGVWRLGERVGGAGRVEPVASIQVRGGGMQVGGPLDGSPPGALVG